ncbi:ankyrin repeat-containing domain protein [Podospora aff. communis PSN243]|uniref:Ankyrin repeat-containing domain protein n=1 Tax=Podospora aff. communis PSN243 TaxID=3040156 RepID=A0AAV9GKD1_9PEZI|nr:ankyrin repeat-containing domain protein [Podospora aff. communis PSN243]
MADPLGAAASIITLVEACGKIVGYIRAVRNGPGERARLLMEVLSTKAILEALHTTSDTIPSLIQGPLDALQTTLVSLQNDLAVASNATAKTLRSRAKGLVWPFTKHEVEEQLRTLDRYKLLLTLALDNDHIALSREIHRDTLVIREDVANLKCNVTAMRNDLQQNEESHQRTAILNWLTEVDYVAQQHDFFARCQEGTGRWLIESDQFRHWINTEQETLFCPGIPGSGKTIISSVVVNYLATLADSEDTGLAYIYCNFRQQSNQTPGRLLISLLKQLAGRRHDSLPDPVRSLYRTHFPRQTRPSIEEILSTLLAVAASYSHVFVVIDALDECQDLGGGRSEFLTRLFSLQAESGMSILATSRPIPEVIHWFQDATTVEIRATPSDVERYIKTRIPHLPSFVSRNPSLQEEIKRAIVEAVDGMFLLAQLHLDSLIGKTSPKALRLALANLHSGSGAYQHAYEAVMERISEQSQDQKELAIQVLLWITFAHTPLLAEELQHALAVEAGTRALDKDNIPDLDDMVSTCAGMVTVDEESRVVRLVHYTAQEFLDTTWERWFPDAEATITTACATYLSFDEFQSGACATVEGFYLRLARYPFYRYAASNWGYHVQGLPEVGHEVLDFLNSRQAIEASTQAILMNVTKPGFAEYRPPAFSKFTGLHLSAYFGAENVGRLIFDPADLDSQDAHGRTPLSWAVRMRHTSFVSFLLGRSAIVDTRDEDCHMTQLALAALDGDESVVRLLLNAGADIETQDNAGRTPLMHAAMQGHTTVVGQLLDHGARIDAKTTEGWVALHCATMRNQLSTVTQLIQSPGINIEARTNEGHTPLILAAQHGKTKMVKELLKRGANINTRDRTGRTALSQAINPWFPPADPRRVAIGTALFFVTDDAMPCINLLLSHPDTDPNLADTLGRTPLMHAAMADETDGAVDAAKALLAHQKTNIASKDHYGSDALSIASRHGNAEIIKLLLETEVANVATRDHFGRTPLWWAERQGEDEVRTLLLEHSERHGLRNYEPETPTEPLVTGSDDLVSHVCDVCTLDISRSVGHYQCDVCDGGDFDICMGCYELGARCLDEGHALRQA